MNNKKIARELVKIAQSLVSGLKSRKQLYKDLKDINRNIAKIKWFPSSYEDLSNEVYGKKAMIYVTWDSSEDRERGEEELDRRGYKINYRYNPAGSTSEVQVAYFKGWHWDE